MTLQPTDSLGAFQKSFQQLCIFLNAWMDKLDAKAKNGNEQNLAAYYLWSRFTMSISTISKLLDPRHIPDFFVITRGCIEFAASLREVMQSNEQAINYMNHDRVEYQRYLKLLERYSDPNFDKYAQEYSTRFGEDWKNKVEDKWPNASTLVEKMGLNERKVYCWSSCFSHGNILSFRQFLDGQIDNPEHMLSENLNAIYLSYLGETNSFLDFIWGVIATPESDRCKDDFGEVMKKYLQD